MASHISHSTSTTVCKCGRLARCYPRYVAYQLLRQSLEVAGGPEAINDLFAARLGGFLRDRGETFEVGHMPITVFARERGGGTMIALTPHFWEWEAKDRFVTYDLHAWDLARRYFPSVTEELQPIDGPFWPRFTALSELIADWPEIVGVRCSRSDAA